MPVEILRHERAPGSPVASIGDMLNWIANYSGAAETRRRLAAEYLEARQIMTDLVDGEGEVAAPTEKQRYCANPGERVKPCWQTGSRRQ